MIKRELSGGVKVILVDDVPPEDVAMVQALYSRCADSAEVHLRQIYDLRRAAFRKAVAGHFDRSTQAEPCADAAFEAACGAGASERAGKFMSRYYVGYGHKSIADCGTTTLFIEGVSMLCAKAVQNSPLYSGQETSTRYLNMEERLAVDPAGTSASATCLSRWREFYARGTPIVRDWVRLHRPRRTGEDEGVYERAAAARTFDVMRGFLPAGTTTQLSWTTNLRQAADHLAWLLCHPLGEVRAVARGIADVLREAYPSSFTLTPGAGLSGVGAGGGDAERRAWLEDTADRYTYLESSLRPSLTGRRPPRFSSTISNFDLAYYANVIETRPRGGVLPHWMSDLGQCTFRFLLDFGSFRDVQRHRNGVCRTPILDVSPGFEPWYLGELPGGLRAEARELIDSQALLVGQVAHTSGAAEAQNYVALGFRVPCRLTYALPPTVYVLELRSGRMVHPTLRARVQDMAADFQEAHPGVRLHLDEELGEWDVRRGAQDITARDAGGAEEPPSERRRSYP